MEEEFRKAALIRKFEQNLFKLLSEKKINGTIHTCIGQEFTGLAIAKFLNKDDIVFSNHRCHGHYLSLTNDIPGLLNEIVGTEMGTNGGRGGSQHISIDKRFYSNGIQGSLVPIGAGAALANKLNNKKNISVIFIGDGTFGSGQVYETFNIASLLEIPVLFVVENNKYAQSTPISKNMAGNIENRAKAFNINYYKTNTYNIDYLYKSCEEAITYCRENIKPVLIEIETYRLVPHSKGDDFRDVDEIKSFEKLDVLNSTLNNIDDNFIDKETIAALNNKKSNYIPQNTKINKEFNWNKCIYDTKRERHNDLIYKAFIENFEKNEKLIMLGLDILYPYGGAFKTTKNLSQLYPDRVIGMPISEASITGIANGLALNGKIPIVEIMFGDFSTLIFDQLLNNATKFKDMYGNCNVPIIIRTPMGGKRGYGPTHSQSLEKFFNGMYGLNIIALNNRISPKIIYDKLFDTIKDPTLVIENKTLYTLALNKSSLEQFAIYQSNDKFPFIKITPVNKEPTFTIVCYGEMLEQVEQSIVELYKENIICEAICITQLYPLNINPLINSVNKTKQLLTIEEGASIGGFGSEIVSRLLQENIKIDKYFNIGYDGIIPSCLSNELQLIPNKDTIVKTLRNYAK